MRLTKILILAILPVILFEGCRRSGEETGKKKEMGDKALQIPSHKKPKEEIRYTSFWMQYPDLFGQRKRYNAEDAGEAEKDRMFEEELAARFRREKLRITPNARLFLEQAKNHVMAKLLYKDTIMEGLEVSTDALRSYFEENRENFKQEEAVDLGHIFIETPPDASEKDVEKARARINAAHKEITEGKPFEAVARVYSEAESASRGGKAGRLTRGESNEEIEKIAFSLEPGQVSPVLHTNFGFHIIKVYKHHKAGIPEFQEVRDSLRNQARKNMEMERLHSLLDYIVSSHPEVISFHKDRLSELTSSTLLLDLDGESHTALELMRRARRYGSKVPPPEKWETLWPLFFQRELFALEADKRKYGNREDYLKIYRWIENYVLSEEYLDQAVFPEITVTEVEMRDLFDQNRGRYIDLEKSRGLVVEFRPEIPDTPVKRHLALEGAKKMLSGYFQGADTEKDFRERANSFIRKHPKSARYFDTGLIVAASMGRIYDMAITPLSPGEKSDPLETEESVAIVFCLEKTPSRRLSFEEARGRVRAELLSRKKQEKRAALRKELTEKNVPASPEERQGR